MKEVRNLVDTTCPIIFGPMWDQCHGSGWRWVENLLVSEPALARRKIEDFQAVHGVLNVTIGHAMNSDRLKPVASDTEFGLYARDVEDIISRFKRELDEYGANPNGMA